MIELQTLGRVRLVGDRPGDDASPISAQPKRLALLAYLALVSARGPVRRDAVLALFWPELGDDEARRALRQALHHLRRVVGEDVLLGAGEELSVSGDRFRCDAVEFERLAGAGEPDRALSLYEGDFFAGFHVPDVAAELEEWVDRTRGRLRRHAAAAAWAAAEAAESSGDVAGAVELGRRGCELEPDQEGGWRRLMLLQDRVGDRAGALRSYDDLATRLRREFDAEPSGETAALASRLRSARLPGTSPREPLAGSAAAPPQPASATESPAAGSAPTPAPDRRRAWLTGAALAGVLLLGLAAVALRSPTEPAGPSLIDEGAIAERDRLLVADFTVTGGDSALGIAIAEAFRVDLAASPHVRVMTPRQVRAALVRMERSAEVAVDDSLARELAMREGVKAFVVGSVSPIGGQWALNVELVGAESGETLAAVRETAADSTELIEAVDRASEALRHRLGESLRDLRRLPPLAQEMTASLPALRRYTEGMRLAYGSERRRSIQLLNEAVAIDSTFSSAHLALAHQYGAIAEPGRATEALERALAHLERLPYQDRQFLIGSDAYNRQDFARSIEAYTEFLARYPAYAPALNNLALAHRDARNLAEAERLWRRAIEVDSTIIQLYFGLHSALVLAGKFDESRRTLDAVGLRAPENPLLLTVEVQDAVSRQDWAEAERRAEATIAAKQADSLDLVDAIEQMAGIVMTQGRLEEAERHWRTQLALAAAAGSWSRHHFGARQLGRLHLRFRGNRAAAIAIVDSALARMPLDSMLPGDRFHYEWSRFFAEAGELPRARTLLAQAAATDSLLRRALPSDRAWTEGVLALAEGRPDDAEPRLRQAAERSPCAICALPELARARDARGDAAGALEAYERYVATPWFFRHEIDAYELGPALRRLAELRDARGDARGAAEARGRLLALWRRADAELQPVLADVRTGVTAPAQ